MWVCSHGTCMCAYAFEHTCVECGNVVYMCAYVSVSRMCMHMCDVSACMFRYAYKWRYVWPCSMRSHDGTLCLWGSVCLWSYDDV